MHGTQPSHFSAVTAHHKRTRQVQQSDRAVAKPGSALSFASMDPPDKCKPSVSSEARGALQEDVAMVAHSAINSAELIRASSPLRIIKGREAENHTNIILKVPNTVSH